MAQAYVKGLRLVILADVEEVERIMKEISELFEIEIEYVGRCG